MTLRSIKREITAGELIDTLWNVNKEVFADAVSASQELIDTLWNVNNAGVGIEKCESPELIDTLWNVNSFIPVCTALAIAN